MSNYPTGRACRWLAALLFFAVSSGVALAQSANGAIAGNITDQTGAVISGATVTATDQGTGGKTVTTSTSSGSYRFPDLHIGSYTVAATAPGFSTATNTGVLVSVNIVATLDVKLQPGAVTESVTVDASGLRLETETSDLGGTVSNRQIEDLPLALASGVGGLRSPETFVFLVPGTTGPGSGTAGNTGNGVFFSRLSGGQAYGAEVLLDGASTQRSENGSSYDETSPSIEALQEFKVTTSTPQAEFGRTTSGIESFATKSGANQFHGQAYMLVKNRAFDANSWFNNAYKSINCIGVSEINCQYSKPQDSKYDYGGVLSGPVRIPHFYNGKDRTFFLFSWENYQLHQSFSSQSTVPTAAERTGDFRDILGAAIPANLAPYNKNPCTGEQIYYNEIFDPHTDRPGPAAGQYCRSSFATPNVIPTAELSPAAQKLLAGLPLPNQAGTLNAPFPSYNNYASTGTQPITNTTYTIRIDQIIGTNSRIFATYDTRENFKLTGAPNLPAPFNSNGFTQDFTTHYARAGWDYTFSPTLLNHLNLGYNRTNSLNLGASFNSPNATAANIPGLVAPFFPLLNFVGPENLTTLGLQGPGNTDRFDNGIRINDDVNWQKGRNSFKFGVDVRFQQYSVLNYDTDSLTFYRDQTSVQNFGPQFLYDGSTFASFLTGYVGGSSQTVYNDVPRWNSHYLAGYAQDDLKFSSNLTLNLGVRYDVDVPRHEALNRTSNFSLTAPDPAAGNLPGALVFGVNCKCNTAWADTWYKDVAPRIGFAYVLPGTNNKAVLRGGGAIIYGPLQYNDFGNGMTSGYTQSRSPAGAFPDRGIFGHSFQLDTGFQNADGSALNFAPSLDPGQLTGGVGQFYAVGGNLITPGDGRPSMTSNWSLQLQDEIAQDLVFKMGYIGQVSQNLRSGDLTNFNNISKQYFSLGDRLSNGAFFIPEGGANSGVKAPYPTFAGNLGQALRPFPQYDFIQGDCCLENLGHSSYNAMVVSLERRFRNGFNLQASYTWSKTLTDADSAIPFSYVNGNQLEQGQDNTNLKLEKAVSVQNIPETLSLSYLYQLPFGKGRRFLNSNRALDLVIGGWEVGAIQRYQSGQNISFGCASGIPYYQNCISFSEGPAAGATQDYTTAAFKANKNGPNQFNGQSWFKPAYRPAGTNGATDPGAAYGQAAFVDQNAEGPFRTRALSPACGGGSCSFDPFTLGDIPRVTQAITGPGFKSEDLSLLKDFHLSEKYVFQLKAEAIDLFNRHRFALPILNPNVSTGNGFGIPTGTDYGPRNLQLTGKFNF